MRKSKQRKLEKKRRAKREHLSRKPVSLAYQGNKYRNEETIPLVFQTEIGIYESFVMSDRRITDHHVRRALERLIREVRGGEGCLSSRCVPNDLAEQESEENLIVWNIRQHWEEYAEKEPFPDRGILIGVLRTILGSIETWGNISPTSRGYLRYLEGFMGKLGVNCRQVPPELAEQLLVAEADGDLEPFEDDLGDDDDELLAAGRAWADGEKSAGVVFRSLAEEMIEAGEAQQVAETCQQVLGVNPPKHIREELMRLSLGAQQRLPPPPSRLRHFFHRLIGR
ncbi:MAG: hypothetical protein KKA28_03890 [Planctomycetes bacterium]|nr:hypothetical protein [Planctomycetota bacterium]MCG2684467.1 hypothetical protein [Planctomycetales bacterium]